MNHLIAVFIEPCIIDLKKKKSTIYQDLPYKNISRSSTVAILPMNKMFDSVSV